jgi:xylulokinase
MQVPVLLGIDLGTSSTKVSAVDTNGHEVACGASKYLRSDPCSLATEADTSSWWLAVKGAVRQAMSGGNLQVQGIGLSGQMHGVVPVDARGSTIRNPITWADTRSSPHIAALSRIAEAYRSSILNRIIPGFAVSILYWLSKAEPETISRMRWALQPKDWLGLRLTGNVSTEATDASATGLWDFDGVSWHRRFCQAIPIDERLLPPVLESEQARGHLRSDVARELGLAPGVPVVHGQADTSASHLGSSSSLDPGDTILTLGTGAQLCQLLANAPTEPPEGIMALAGPGNFSHYAMAPIYSFGMALNWARELWSLDWNHFFDTAFSSPTVLDTPFLAPFSPENISPSRVNNPPGPVGSWLGLNPDHDHSDLLRAAVDGCMYTLRSARDNLLSYHLAADFTSCILVGGGARDSRLRQLVADVLGIVVKSPDTYNASARGAALSASPAAGWFKSAREACREFRRPISVLEPDPAAHRLHTQRFQIFQSLIADRRGRAL